MATVKIDRFGGIAPRIHPTQLRDGMAVEARNCRLKTGKLVPLRQPSRVVGVNMWKSVADMAVKDAKSLHVWRRASGAFDFLLFPGVTWLAEGNIADDDKMRAVVSGDRTGTGAADEPVAYIREGSGYVVHPLVKAALGTPHVVRLSEGELTDNRRYTYFFVTWVDAYGYESPCSAPSKVSDGSTGWIDGDLEYMDGDTVKVTGFASGVSASVKALVKKVRLYKVVSGMEQGSGNIQFVAEEAVSSASDFDSLSSNGMSAKVADESLGETMPEIEAPPSDLTCIHAVPGAFYCGFSESKPKTVCFSDINLLYSWPVAYRYDVKDSVVALAVTSNTVFALTDGYPFILSGTAPESMTVTKLAGPAACVSPRGVCVYRNAVYYASNAGLMTIYNSADAGTVCQNLTDGIFTKDQWLALNPASCVMGQFDGALFLYFTLEDGSHKGLTIDLLENMKVAVTTHDEVASCVAVDTKGDRLYFIREGGVA